jgi:hypothetical protein
MTEQAHAISQRSAGGQSSQLATTPDLPSHSTPTGYLLLNLNPAPPR